MIRFFLKILRFICVALIASLLLFCVLFAVLQTRWAKEQIKEQIAASLQQLGINAKIEGLDGQMPFTWTIQSINLPFDQGELKLSQLKFRFAILPLLRGRISINYLKIENGEYSFDAQEPLRRDWTIDEGKSWVKNQLQEIHLPFPISLNLFSIQCLKVMDLKNDISVEVGISGNIKVEKDAQEFFVDLSLFSPDANITYLVTSLYGSEKLNFIDTKFKLDTDSIFSSFSLNTEFTLKGPWSSWKEILYDLPRTKEPLVGQSKGVITGLHQASYPLINRDWKFKSRFSVLSHQELNVQALSLWSNLIGIKGKTHLYQDLQHSKALFAISLPDLSLLSPSLLKGSLKGKVVLQDASFKSSFQTHQLELETFAINTLKGMMNGKVSGQDWEADVKISSSDASVPFESSFALDFIPESKLEITDFELTTEEGKLAGSLDYGFAKELLNGSITIAIDDLDPYSPLVKGLPLSGQFNGELTFTGEDQKQDLFCALIGKNIQVGEILVDDATFSAQITDLYELPQGRFSLLAEKIYTPSFYLDRLNCGTHFDEIHWPFYLDMKGRIESPFECFAQGFWQKENTLLTLELTRLYGELSKNAFALKYPALLEWGSDYLNLSPFHFDVGSGHLFSTFELSPIRSVGRWELNHFPLEILGCIRPRFGLNGYVSSKGFIDATANNLEGVCNAVLEEAGILHFGKKEPILAKGSLQAHLDQGQMQIHTALNASDGQFLDFNGSLPIDYSLYPFKISLDQNKNTSAELVAEGKLQDLFDFVNLGIHHFTGLVSSRLFLSQSLHSPNLKGKIELQNGSYENYFTGVQIRNIDAHLEADNEQIKLLDLKANDEKSGEVTAHGKIDLKPEQHFPFVFDAEMKNLHAVGFNMIDCNLTGPIYFIGNTQAMDAQGNLIIDEAQIQITERLPYEVPTLPVTYINTPKHLARKIPKTPGFQFNIDLELTAENNIRVEGRGLNAELEGNVHLHGTNTAIAANGELKLIKGEYIFSGKVFKLTEGEIIFKDKPTSSSYLNLTGTLSMPDITITAMMRGPLTSPQLTFQSNPQKPTSSLLALILFNKDITEINHPEAIQLAATLVSLSGGAGPDVLESIRKSIGVDRLNITSKPGTDELAVQIGKYLTRGIMITLSQSATSSQVIVEVELPKGFVFQAETQEEEEGKFSLKWRKTY